MHGGGEVCRSWTGKDREGEADTQCLEGVWGRRHGTGAGANALKRHELRERTWGLEVNGRQLYSILYNANQMNGSRLEAERKAVCLYSNYDAATGPTIWHR